MTISLETKYRKPVPYETELIGRGIINKTLGNFFVAECKITDLSGNVLANADVKYLKLDTEKIAQNVDAHEEMCYLIEDGVREINFSD